jgi:integrase
VSRSAPTGGASLPRRSRRSRTRTRTGTVTGFHELRHFYASRLIGDGQSPTVVQARPGHASATETLDTYSHLWPDDEDRTRSVFDAVFKPKPAEDDGLAGVPASV